MARFSLRIDDELLNWIERCALAEGRSMNEQMIQFFLDIRTRYGEPVKPRAGIKPRRRAKRIS